ncbi:MAG: hypothetical protein RLZZ347_438 [Candidatus Parcubacteria bacterium]|jgi:hypothetical protein
MTSLFRLVHLKFISLLVVGFFFLLLSPATTHATTPAVSLVQSATTTQITSSTISATLPAGALGGHLLVAIIGGAGSAVTVTSAPAGFTLVGSSFDGVGTVSQAFYYKIATGGERTVSATFSANPGSLGMQLYEYKGVNLYVASNSNSGNSTTMSTGTLTPPDDNELIIAAYTIKKNTDCVVGSWTDGNPARENFTQQTQMKTTTSGHGGLYCGGAQFSDTTGLSYGSAVTLSVAGPWVGQVVSFKDPPDIDPPTIGFTAATQVSSTTMPVSLHVTDNVSVTSSNVVIDGASTATVTGYSCAQTDAATVDCTFDVTTSGTVIVDATDDYLNEANSTHTFTLDITPPTLSDATWVDTDSSGTMNGNDQLVLTFNDAMDTSTITADGLDAKLGISNGHTLGTAGDGMSLNWTNTHTLTITLGSDSTLATSDTVSPVSSVTDQAGNAITVSSPVSIVDDAYHGEFWNYSPDSASPSFPERSPDFVQNTSAISYNWGGGSPDGSIGGDQFLARWTKTTNFTEGWYEFSVTIDDGMRVYVDNTLIMDNWSPHGGQTYTRQRYLSAGPHEIKVEYFEEGGGATAVFSYSSIDTPASPALTLNTGISSPISENRALMVNITTDQAGYLTFGGSCSAGSTHLSIGPASITFYALSPGTYSDCTITLASDATDLVSNSLAIPSFEVDPAPSDVYVDPSYSSEGAGGHTWNVDAYSTLHDGIGAVAPAGTVHVAAGTYTEDSDLIIPNTLAGVTIQGAGVTQSFIKFSSSNYRVRLNASTSTLDGFNITNAIYNEDGSVQYYGNRPVVRVGGGVTNALISNNAIHGGKQGVALGGCDDGGGAAASTTVRNNELYDNESSGVLVDSGNYNLITDNLIHDNRHSGLSAGVIVGDMCRNGDGIQIGNIVRHNTIYDNENHGITVRRRSDPGEGFGTVIDNNLIYHNNFNGHDQPMGIEDLAPRTQIINNTISGNAGYGIRLGGGDWYNNANDAYINGNIIGAATINETSYSGNSRGGIINYNASNVVVHNNQFINSTIGISNRSDNSMDATDNYWGASSGPTVATNPLGTGDSIGPNSDSVSDQYSSSATLTGITLNATLNDTGNNVLLSPYFKDSGLSIMGTIGSAGSFTERGFEYGRTTSYGSRARETSGSFDTGSYNKTISGLSCGTTYHYRAYTVYGGSTFRTSDDTFSTVGCDYDSHWTFDEGEGATAHDSSGNGNDINYYTGTIGWDTGKFGSAFSFDGSVYLGGNRPVSNDFTICAWVKTTVVGNGNVHWTSAPIFDSEVGGLANDFSFGIDSDGHIMYGNGGSFDATVNGSTIVNDNAWHDVCVVRNKTTGGVTLYVDKTVDATGTTDTATLSGRSDALIGYGYDGPAHYTGLIDDLRIYARDLTATEIASVYENKTLHVPTITMNGAEHVVVYRGSTYTDLGATASDTTDGNITGSIVTSNTVDTSTSGTYTVTYNVTDSLGSQATPAVRYVDVIPTSSTQTTISAATTTAIYIPQNVSTATLDISAFQSGNSSIIPATTTISSTMSTGSFVVTMPPSITVTSSGDTWDGILNLPQPKTANDVTLPTTSGKTTSFSSAIEVGLGDTSVTFDKGVRLLFTGGAAKLVGWQRSGVFTPVTTICADDSQTTGDALSSGADCKIDSGSDLVVWTKHFTTYVVYTQADTSASAPATVQGNGPPSIPSGGGGGGGSFGFLYNNPLTIATSAGTSQKSISLKAHVSTSTAPILFTRTLRNGDVDESVRRLQVFLNTHGFLIAKSGDGSLGHETTKFGAKTRIALAAFQQAHAQTLLAPQGLKKGTGILGSLTMKYINSLLSTRK